MNNRIRIAEEFAEAIKSEYIEQIILFGSVARGDDTEDSDIDILIVSNHRDKIWYDISDVISDFIIYKQEVISVHVFSKQYLDDIKDFSFIRNIEEEGVVIG